MSGRLLGPWDAAIDASHDASGRPHDPSRGAVGRPATTYDVGWWGRTGMAWPRLHRRSWPAGSIPEASRPAHPGSGGLREGARRPLRRAPCATIVAPLPGQCGRPQLHCRQAGARSDPGADGVPGRRGEGEADTSDQLCEKALQRNCQQRKGPEHNRLLRDKPQIWCKCCLRARLWALSLKCPEVSSYVGPELLEILLLARGRLRHIAAILVEVVCKSGFPTRELENCCLWSTPFMRSVLVFFSRQPRR